MADPDTSATLAERQHAAGHQHHMVLRARKQGSTRTEPDRVAVEIPVALEYNGISHAVMLATPTDLEDLAYGFSYTEGIVRSPDDIYDIETVEQADGMVVQVHVASACMRQLKSWRRALAGRTGCGLCGIESLNEVRRNLPAVTRTAPPLPYSIMLNAARSLIERQALHQLTGATHAAAWADNSGRLMCVREDVGRHNALDKLIGYALRTGIDMGDGLVVVSSRASFEMVQKAAAAGISVLAAVSAPTSFAIRVAQELNVLLAGFVRENHFTIYTHPQHLASYGDNVE